MKVLFEFSRSGLPSYEQYLNFIRKYLIKHDHVLTNDLIEETKQEGIKNLPEEIFTKVTRSISEAQCVIIEASEISISLGYILTKSISLGKPVLFLRNTDSNLKKSRFVDSISSKLLKSATYSNQDELEKILNSFFQENKHIKTRFNLVMPSEVDSYVTEKSQEKGVSKTEYILDLVNKDKKS
jgi:hypothetical protein